MSSFTSSSFVVSDHVVVFFFKKRGEVNKHWESWEKKANDRPQEWTFGVEKLTFLPTPISQNVCRLFKQISNFILREWHLSKKIFQRDFLSPFVAFYTILMFHSKLCFIEFNLFEPPIIMSICVWHITKKKSIKKAKFNNWWRHMQLINQNSRYSRFLFFFRLTVTQPECQKLFLQEAVLRRGDTVANVCASQKVFSIHH